MKVKSEKEVAQSYPILSDPMDYSLPGSSIHGIFQARVLEWVAIAFSALVAREPKIHSRPRDFVGNFSLQCGAIPCSRVAGELPSLASVSWGL